MGKILKRIYPNIRVNKEGLARVREALTTSPVLLLPTHRSYMDFLVLSYVFYFMHVPVPIIAAGEDFERMTIVGSMLRGCGAFFMRRSFGSDLLYWALFSEYVQHIVSNGDAPVEFFVEGTRSRTGKSLHPKIGLLSIAVQPYLDCRVADITAFPITISYHERMESNLYVTEMLGTPKPKESLSGLLRAKSVLEHDHGRLHVCVGPAISVREFFGDKADRGAHASQPGSFVMSPAQRHAVGNLAYEVVLRQQGQLVVMMPAIVSTLVLANPKWNCISIAAAQADTSQLAAEITSRGGNVDIEDSIFTAIDALAPAGSVDLKAQTLSVMPSTPEEALLLAHYRNELVHVFAAEAICATAVTTLGSMATLKQLLHEFSFIHSMLYYEFVLPSTKDDRHLCMNALQDLRLTGVVEQPKHSPMTGFCPLEDQQLKVVGVPMLALLLSLTKPLLASVAVVIDVLVASPVALRPDDLMLRARQQATQEWKRVGLYPDSMSANSLQNAVHALTHSGLLKHDPDQPNLLQSPLPGTLSATRAHISRILACGLEPVAKL